MLGEQALETIQLTLGQIYTVIFVTASVVAGGAWWVWKIVDNVRGEAKSALDQHKKDQSEENAELKRTLITIVDSRKAEARLEWDKLWNRLEAIRDTAVHKADLQNMETKLDTRLDRLFDQMNKIVLISEQQVNHEVRLKNIEDVMKMD